MLPFLLSVILVWSLDRVSKKLAIDRLRSTSHISFGLFTLRLKYHQIGIWRFHSLSSSFLWILASAAAVTLIVVIGGEYSTPVVQIALGAAVGGGAGNLYDLWRFGAIQDFIHFKFSVFNIADMAIICGITVTIFAALLN